MIENKSSCCHQDAFMQCIYHSCRTNIEGPCTWENWSSWTSCELIEGVCGNGFKMRNKTNCTCSQQLNETCEVSPIHIQSCHIVCNGQPSYLEWGNWGECLSLNGNGTMTRYRMCESRNGSQTFSVSQAYCDGIPKQLTSCNVSIYNFGSWNAWSDESENSIHRRRFCIVDNKTVVDSSRCNGTDIESVNYTSWSLWGPCNNECLIGKRRRHRTCQYFGLDQSFKERCANGIKKHEAVENCTKNNCSVSRWQSWSNCSVSCGKGMRSRRRNCRWGGRQLAAEMCSGSNRSLLQKEECEKICHNETESLCPPSHPYAFGSGKFCCAHVIENDHWKGTPCNAGELSVNSTCCERNMYIKCEGSTCKANTDGTSKGIQSLGCWLDSKQNPTIPMLEEINNTEINGVRRKYQIFECYQAAIAKGFRYFALQNGGYCMSSATAGNTYTKYGRSDKCHGYGKGGDLSNDVYFINETFTYSAWNESECSVTCGAGKMISTRNCLVGENMCIGESRRVTDCGTSHCPVDGDFSVWSEWTTCSRSCGSGQQIRLRTCSNPYPLHNGKNCFGAFNQSRNCTEELHCPGNYLSGLGKDCKSMCESLRFHCAPYLKDFNEKEVFVNNPNVVCASNIGAKELSINHKYWSKKYHPSYNTKTGQCEGYLNIKSNATCKDNVVPEYIQSICNCQPAGEILFGEWSMFGECSKECGYGIKRRFRQCLHTSECTLYDVKQCNMVPCAIDGGWSHWHPWRECSVTCGGGKRKKIRGCEDPQPLFGGRACTGVSEAYEGCNFNICPIDGKFSEWSEWSMCDRPCGKGNQTRERYCNNPKPELGGKPCRGERLENQICVRGRCLNVHLSVAVVFVNEVYQAAYGDLTSKESLELKERLLKNVQLMYQNSNGIKVKDIDILELRRSK